MKTMALEIRISSELEQQLQQAAAQVGLAPDVYAMQLLAQGLTSTRPQSDSGQRLSPNESALIQRINRSFSQVDWARYETLLAKREDETLTADEQTELIHFSDQLEALNVDRMQALSELSQIRQTSIQALMDELGLKPVSHG